MSRRPPVAVIPPYRLAIQEALDYTQRSEPENAYRAWLKAADMLPPYDMETRSLCGSSAVACFNAAHRLKEIPRALDVVYWADTAEAARRGSTRGKAYLLFGVAMIQIEGINGGFPLSKVAVLS